MNSLNKDNVKKKWKNSRRQRSKIGELYARHFRLQVVPRLDRKMEDNFYEFRTFSLFQAN